MTSQSSKIFFFHIPKCAGTSVWKHLAKIYGRGRIFQIASSKDVERFNQESPENLRRYAVIGGHHFLSTYRERLGNFEEYFKVTSLRDPIDRIISNYNFIRRDWRHARYKDVRQSTFEEFSLKEAANAQTKLLADNTDDYKRAIEILDGWFDYYTTLDHADLLMRKLSEVGNAPFKRAIHKNVSKRKIKRDAIDPDLIRRLEQMHEADLRLLDHAKNRQERFAALPASERVRSPRP